MFNREYRNVDLKRLYNEFNLDIDGNKVKSELKTGYLLYLYVTNTLAMMVRVLPLPGQARTTNFPSFSNTTLCCVLERVSNISFAFYDPPDSALDVIRDSEFIAQTCITFKSYGKAVGKLRFGLV